MAIASNKVVTFKDLYGLSVPSLSGTIESPFIPFYVRGLVLPDSTISKMNVSYPVYYYEKYSKRLKYLYYGYALIGLNSTDLHNLTGPLERKISGSSSSYPIFYTNAANTVVERDYPNSIGYVPLWHFGNLTGYSGDTAENAVTGNNYTAWSFTNSTIDKGIIKYSEISTMDLRNPQTYEVFTEYHPIKDPSTGEIMKDEEGNVLYEEGESYMEIKSEDSSIL